MIRIMKRPFPMRHRRPGSDGDQCQREIACVVSAATPTRSSPSPGTGDADARDSVRCAVSARPRPLNSGRLYPSASEAPADLTQALVCDHGLHTLWLTCSGRHARRHPSEL